MNKHSGWAVFPLDIGVAVVIANAIAIAVAVAVAVVAVAANVVAVAVAVTVAANVVAVAVAANVVAVAVAIDFTLLLSVHDVQGMVARWHGQKQQQEVSGFKSRQLQRQLQHPGLAPLAGCKKRNRKRQFSTTHKNIRPFS